MSDDNGTGESANGDQGGQDGGASEQGGEAGKADPADYQYVQHDDDSSDLEERSDD